MDEEKEQEAKNENVSSDSDITDTVKELRPPDVRAYVAHKFANDLSRKRDRFNSDEFLKACNVIPRKKI